MRKSIVMALALGVLVSAGGKAMAEGDPARGEQVFKRCLACHVVEPGGRKIGPSLYGVIGREAGTLEGFRYSPAMQNADFVWTEERIKDYLENPRKYVPGNRMAFVGLRNPQDREDVVAYLRQFSE